MNLEGIVWADIETASMRTRAHGTKIWDLWKGENGAKAMIVKIEAGGKIAELDVHEPGAEEVYVAEGIFNDGVEIIQQELLSIIPKALRTFRNRKQVALFLFFTPKLNYKEIKL